MNQLGAAIVAAMDESAQTVGAKFALMSRVPSLNAAMEARDIPVLDLSNVMNNADLTLEGDPHPNAAANGIITLELMRFLKQNNLVPQRYWRGE